MLKTPIAIIILFSTWALKTLEAQPSFYSDLQADYQLRANYIDTEVNIDGVLEEEIWQSDEVAKNFWMSFPNDEEQIEQEYDTEVRIAFDDKNIYVGAICRGSGPYVMPSLKRDASSFWSGDAFAIVLDPVNEKTNAFSFGINTAGVQTEALITGGVATRGGGGSSVINTAWDNTWHGEVKVYEDAWTAEIAIPFKSLRFSDKQMWGINFIRGISKKNEWHTWSPVPVQFMGIDLTYTGALIWEEIPKASKSNISVIPYTLSSHFKDFEDNSTKNNFQLGGDAKVAITPSLNLDLTINPDFSQVDVDVQVTNLSTVNIRFPERRLFFLENSDLYSDFGIPPMRPFFSRKIGLDDDGNTIPIAFGARLSGNLNKDLRIGVMNLQTKSNDEFSGQNYTSLTAHQQVLGRSVIKGYFHNRQSYIDGSFSGMDFNRIAGLEFNYRSNNGAWLGTAGYGKSWTPNLDGDNFFYNAIINYNSRNLRIYSNISGVGNNYRADMGFIPRFDHYDAVRDTTIKIGFHHGFTNVNYRIIPKDNSVINSHNFSIRNVWDYTKDGWDLIQNVTTLGYDLNWANTSSIELEFTHNEQGLIYPFNFTGENPLPTGIYKFNFVNFEYNSDSRKPLQYGLGFRSGGFYNGTRKEYSVEFNYRAQPWGNFSMNFVYNDLQFPEDFGTRELFLISPRFELNFSRALFWTTFFQYNTQRENFNINSRVQWRFKPLSDIFLVYTDNYATDIWGPKNRGVVLKMNYWINL